MHAENMLTINSRSDFNFTAAMIDSPEVARRNQGTSLHSFLASLSVSALLLGAETLLFFLLKDRITQLYQPRTYLVPKERRVTVTPLGFLRWLSAVFHTSDLVILQKSGLDAFFFMRYLGMLLKVFVLLSLLIIPVLIPLNFVHGKSGSGGVQGLDALTWANMRLAPAGFYWIHLCMALIVITYVCYTIYAEMQDYVRIRQLYLASPQRRLQDFANAVLVTGIPDRYLTHSRLTELYSVYPGGVRAVWINRDLSKLSRKVQDRESIVCMLEAAEARLIKSALKSRGGSRRLELSNTKPRGSEPRWQRYLGRKGRESMRRPIFNLHWLPCVPFLGEKVDTIDYCLQELARLNKEIDLDKRQAERFPLMNSAFIQFNNQAATYMACQSLVKCIPLSLKSHNLEVSAEDMKWDNLSQRWWMRYIRALLVVGCISAVILAWSIPVALTGLVSQITYLAAAVPWLKWIDSLPMWFLGFIQGVMPQILVTVLFAMLPYLLRAIAERRGLLTEVAVELSLQKYYFTFLFIQVFLTVSVSSSIAAIIQQTLHGLDSVPTVLAKNLPIASNYFLSYLLLQCFSISASSLLQIGRLLEWCYHSIFADLTPRNKWKNQTDLPQMQWGTCFPVYTNLACIGLVYSIVAPLILLFSSVAFGLFWMVFRYNLLYVTVSRPDTKSSLYPTALNQLFVGVYVMELYLIGLFLIVRDEHRWACIGQAVIMIVAMVMTVFFQIILNEAFSPCLRFLPNADIENESETETEGRARSCQSMLQRLLRFILATRDSRSYQDAFLEIHEEMKRTSNDSSKLLAFQHKSLRIEDPVVWIPNDPLGISNDEVTRVRQRFSNIKISNKHASLDENGKLMITQGRSAFSDVELMNF